MPSVKQGGGYTLTFAKKNDDVKCLLAKKKLNKVVITDYICDAVRFYEANKDNMESDKVSIIAIKELIKNEIAAALQNVPQQKEIKNPAEEAVDLEEDLDYVDTDED